MLPGGKEHGQIIEGGVEVLLQLLKYVGSIFLEFLTSHRLEHLLELHAQLLYVVHEDARLQKEAGW